MSGNNRFIRAPFIDPVTGIAYDTNNSEFEGYLTKQSLWLRVSLMRFFSISLMLSTLLVMMVRSMTLKSITRYSALICHYSSTMHTYRIGVDGSLY